MPNNKKNKVSHKPKNKKKKKIMKKKSFCISSSCIPRVVVLLLHTRRKNVFHNYFFFSFRHENFHWIFLSRYEQKYSYLNVPSSAHHYLLFGAFSKRRRQFNISFCQFCCNNSIKFKGFQLFFMYLKKNVCLSSGVFGLQFYIMGKKSFKGCCQTNYKLKKTN